MNCSNCPFIHNRENVPEPKELKFWNEGVIETAKMKPVNDAFYEITEGKYKGSLVHTFNVIKNKF